MSNILICVSIIVPQSLKVIIHGSQFNMFYLISLGASQLGYPYKNYDDLADNIFGPQSDSDVDLGATGVRWKDASGAIG